ANCAYNQTMSMVLEGHLNYKAMEQAVHGMVERHEALRCSFSRDGQQVYIYSEGKTTLTYNDLSHLNAADQQSFLTEYAWENSRTPFDLEAGSLLRVFLFKLAADRHVLLFTVHHIVCDGWSISLFLEELSKLYSSYSRGLEPALPAPLGMEQYVHEAIAFSKTASYSKAKNYWLNKFKDHVPTLELP